MTFPNVRAGHLVAISANSSPMLDRFSERFELTTASGVDDLDVPSIRALWGGATLEHGLYRLHTEASGSDAHRWMIDAFPRFAGWFGLPIGFDWLGRQFAPSKYGSSPIVLLADVGAAEVLEIPATLEAFHDQVLVDDEEPALAASFFAAWREQSGATDLPFDKCVGYRVPLFLGGSDTLDNLEVSDLDVYWTITGQLAAAARG